MTDLSSLVSILSVTGLVTTLAAAGFSVLRIFAKRQAESKLVGLLRHRYDEQPQVRRLLKELVATEVRRLEPWQIEQYYKVVLAALAELSNRDRHELEEAVNQPSPRGREAYLLKLADEVATTHEQPAATVH